VLVISLLPMVKDNYIVGIITNKFNTYIKDNEGDYTNCVLVAFMIGKVKDPQRGIFISPNISYISALYNTLNQYRVPSTIFYDVFESPEQWETKYVQFKKIHAWDYNKAPNDARFILWREFLENNTQYEYSVCLDASDTSVNSNPFEFYMKNTDYKLFIGSENDLNDRHYKDKTFNPIEWMKNMIRYCYSNINTSIDYMLLHTQLSKTFYNCGIVGGKREYLLKLLNGMVDVIKNTYSGLICDMPVLNYELHSRFYRNEIMTGYPLHTKFFSYEKNSIAIFTHK